MLKKRRKKKGTNTAGNEDKLTASSEIAYWRHIRQLAAGYRASAAQNIGKLIDEMRLEMAVDFHS